jgi:thioredoxin-related protein
VVREGVMMGNSLYNRWLLWAVGCFLLFGLRAAALAQDQGESKAEKPKKPALYDPNADARAQVEAAVARARRDHSRVLVMFGFEACSWCHKLHRLFEQDEEISKLLRDEYVLVLVDINAPHADELLREVKGVLAPDDLQKAVGFPFLGVLDGNGKVVTAQPTGPLEKGKGHEPALVKKLLDRWVAPRADARAVLEAALARAAKDDKRVFLHFGAPWCGWRHRLDDFLARPEIAAVLGPDFVDAKIDIDRMDHGKEVMAEYRKGEDGSIPWFVILDAKGKALATSDGPKGNVGYPAQPHEIEHFLAMLKQTARKMGPGQLDRVEAALRQARKDLARDSRR